MAEIEIAEYAYESPPRLAMPTYREPEAVFTLLTYAASTQHTFGPTTKLVWLKPRTGRAYVKFGENPTAAAETSKSIEQNAVLPFEVKPGSKVAVYDGIS